MARYLRVRATRPNGVHRAGMFHGVKPVVYDTHELTADQVALLRGENGRLLLVDEVADPDAATVVPDGDKVGPGDTFVSHPQFQERAQAAEAERDTLAAQVAELQKQLADVQGERDAAQEALKAAPPEPKPEGNQRAQAIVDAVRQVVESGEGLTAAGVPKVDALEALLGFDVTAAERDAAYQAYSEA